MPDSPETAAQKLLDAMPDGCELETSVRDTGAGWEATARLIHPDDTPRPQYLGKGATEEEALLRAIGACAYFWEWRRSGGMRDWNPLTQKSAGRP